MSSEYRIALTPAGARELVSKGHEVVIEDDAGLGSGLPNDFYEKIGAKIGSTQQAWDSDLVLKVKEPLAAEFKYLRKELTLFTFLHLAAHKDLTVALAESGCTSIAYETVTDSLGRLPLLAPMSEIAGRMAPQAGAHYLEKSHGSGVLLGGVSGVRPARVVVIGAGTSGRNAAFLAAGMEAEVLLLDKNIDRLREVDFIHRGRIMTLYSDAQTVEECVQGADLVIGAVLVAGAKAPMIVSDALVKTMRPGSVIVDISIDQGGCVETSHVTTHTDPIYKVHDVVHYCVGNMPGAVPNTSTYALTNATIPYVELIAAHGVQSAALRPDINEGINTAGGSVTNSAVAAAHGLEWVSATEALGL